MFVDYLAKRESCNVQRFKKDKLLKSEIETLHATRYTNNGIVLAKTTTFMNESGFAVKACVTRYTLHVTRNLIVVHDDLDIPLGKFRIVKGYGPKLHNGIDSIEEKLGTKDFLRVRIGVDNRTPENRIPGIEYVLQDFEEGEKKITLDIFSQIIELLKMEKYILL